MSSPVKTRTGRLAAAGACLLAFLSVLAVADSANAATATTPPGSFTYTGTWGNNTTEYWSNQAGATATAFFTVSSGGGTVALRGVKHAGQGIEAVSVDGGAESNVNMYSATQQAAAVVYTSPKLTAGAHSVRIRVTGTKDSRSSGTYASNTGANLSNGVFTAQPQPSGVTLNRDFDTCDYSQWTGNSNLEAGTPSQQSVISSTVTRTGSGCSNKFQIANTPGHQVSNGSFRSLWAQYDSQEGTVGGSDFAYGFSFRTPRAPSYEHIWELHQRENIYSVGGAVSVAPHAVMLRDGQLQYREMTGAAHWDGSQWTGYANYQDQKTLIPTVAANTWYDVIVHIKASEGPDGLTEVFARQAGQSWPVTPTWSNAGPSLPFVPGGLDPNVPSKRSTYDPASDGTTGLYLEAGIYNGSTSWGESFSPVDVYLDQLRRYTDVASAKTGFPN